jgi:RNA polymerase sigma-70 factor (ECF subfamily)
LTSSGNNIANQIRNGNEIVFEQLFREYYPRLCGYALKYVWEKDQAEEIVQELFYSLWEKSSTLVITISVEAYLFRAVRNACYNYIKHLKIRDQHAEFVKDSLHDCSESVDKIVELLELQDKIDKAIEMMPQERKKIFTMSRVEGLKYRDIAKKLNISVKTVEAQMGKALEFLREKLSQYLVIVILLVTIIRVFSIFLTCE